MNRDRSLCVAAVALLVAGFFLLGITTERSRLNAWGRKPFTDEVIPAVKDRGGLRFEAGEILSDGPNNIRDADVFRSLPPQEKLEPIPEPIPAPILMPRMPYADEVELVVIKRDIVFPRTIYMPPVFQFHYKTFDDTREQIRRIEEALRKSGKLPPEKQGDRP